jgi:hypothetical protein
MARFGPFAGSESLAPRVSVEEVGKNAPSPFAGGRFFNRKLYSRLVLFYGDFYITRPAQLTNRNIASLTPSSFLPLPLYIDHGSHDCYDMYISILARSIEMLTAIAKLKLLS